MKKKEGEINMTETVLPTAECIVCWKDKEIVDAEGMCQDCNEHVELATKNSIAAMLYDFYFMRERLAEALDFS